MGRLPLAVVASVLALLPGLIPAADELPFDRSAINRYSLDGLPRSISIRQGTDIWLGYDLERAAVCKVWRAPEGKTGLEGELTMKSVGEALFEDQSEDGWQLADGGALKARYLGCTQGEGYFELRWQLRSDSQALLLSERVPIGADDTVRRELKVEGLKADESLLLPATAGAAWKTADGKPAKELKADKWIKLTI